MADSQQQGRRLEFISCLGSGGFGDVYLARLVTSSGLQRRVAVKTLQTAIALRSDAVQRLRDEARLLAALHHRAILQVLDLVDIDGRLGLITEYVEGQDLSAIIAAGELLPVRAALDVIGELAGALDAALTTPSPESGEPLALVHRDIKPGNIRLTRTGAVKLLDFGIARSEAVLRESHTGTGLIIGSMGYLAPECLTETEVFAESDIYALGCVLFEELAGRRLYAGVDKRTLTHISIDPRQHDAFVAEHLASLPMRVPGGVRALLVDLLAYHPDDRPSAERVERRCDELSGQLDGPHLRRWARDRRWPDPETAPGELVGVRVSISGLVDKMSTTSASGARQPLGGARAGPSAGRVNPTLVCVDLAQDGGDTALEPDGAARATGGPVPVPSGPAGGGRSWSPQRWTGVALGVAGMLVAGLLGRAALQDAGPPRAGAGGDVSAPVVGTAPAETAASAVAAAPVEATAAPGGGAATPADAAVAAAVAVAAEAAGAAVASAGSPAGSDSAAVSIAAPEATGGDRHAGLTPPAAAPARPTGRVVVTSSVPVQLQGPTERRSPGVVPVGHYTVLADFGDGMKPYGTVEVAEGAQRSVTCSRFVLNCVVE